MFKVKSISSLKEEFIGALEAEIKNQDAEIIKQRNDMANALAAYTAVLNKAESKIAQARSAKDEAESLLNSLEQ